MRLAIRALQGSRELPWSLLLASAVIVLSVGIAIAPAPQRTESDEPHIVARVNGKALTRSALQRVQTDLLELRRLWGEQPSDAEPANQDLERLAMQQLIRRSLMLQEAVRRNLTVTEDQFDQALAELRGRFQDLESFGAWMRERDLDDGTLIETIREDLLTRQVTATLVENVFITEEQIVEYYTAHTEDLVTAEEVRLRIIAVDSREAGEAMLTALSKGANFARLAQEHSLGLRAKQGGDTGWVDAHTLPPPLQLAVDKLEEGEAYGPLETRPNEFLIVAMAGRRALRAKTLDEARPEIERRLLAVHRQRAIQEWLREQEEMSQIEVFVQAGAL